MIGNISSSSSNVFLNSLKDQAASALSERTKKILAIVLVVFSVLVAIVYLYRRCCILAKKINLIPAKQQVSPQEVEKHIADLCREAADKMRIGIAKDKFESAKIFITLKEDDQLWMEEAYIIQNADNFDIALSTKLEEICKNFPSGLERPLEKRSLARLNISWDVYLKDKSGDFDRIYDHHIVSDSRRSRSAGSSSGIPSAVMGKFLASNNETRLVINDKMEFVFV